MFSCIKSYLSDYIAIYKMYSAQHVEIFSNKKFTKIQTFKASQIKRNFIISKTVFILIFLLLVLYTVIVIILPNRNISFCPVLHEFDKHIENERITESSFPGNGIIAETILETTLSPSLSSSSSVYVLSSEEDSITSTSTTTSTEARNNPQIINASCKVPRLDPFHKLIRHLVKDPPPINCSDHKRFPLLFESTLNSSLIAYTEEIKNKLKNVTSCYYRVVKRNTNGTRPPIRRRLKAWIDNWVSGLDEGYDFSNDTFPISIEDDAGYYTMRIPPEHEFIIIFCKFGNETREVDTTNQGNVSNHNDAIHQNSTLMTNSSKIINSTKTNPRIMDMHAFVHEKPDVEERVQSYYKSMEEVNRKRNDTKENVLLEKDKLNVVILGLDSVSHMNFIRFMPQTYSFLKNNLSAVEMQGLNKVGDNTFPVITPMLTSLNKSTLQSTCAANNSTFDDCPFIWKEYASSGYRTSYGEDSTWMGIFNYMLNGFKSPPTDYYLRPFGVAAEDSIATHRVGNANMCYGPRLTFEVLLDYMRKLAFRMGRDKRYFQLIWATSLTHDYLDNPKLGDMQLKETLRWFLEEGFLNQTVFILMSDHGIRWGEIQYSIQGQLEDRLPFLFYVFPEWFQQKYSRALENLKSNQELLTTHFDLYEVLYDLHNLTRLNPNVIEERENSLEESAKTGSVPRGISQFLPIPLSRTCQQAGISQHFCSCNNLKEVDMRKPEIAQAANFIVHSINLIVSKYPECAYLTLAEVKTAHLIESDTNEGANATRYQLSIITSPGEALFEASVRRNQTRAWELMGTITRGNLYGNQSHCVSTKDDKLYCYCADLLEKDDE